MCHNNYLLLLIYSCESVYLGVPLALCIKCQPVSEIWKKKSENSCHFNTVRRKQPKKWRRLHNNDSISGYFPLFLYGQGYFLKLWPYCVALSPLLASLHASPCVATTLASPHGPGGLVAMTAPPVLLNIPGRGHIPVRRAARGHRQPCFIKVSAPPPSPHTR